MRSLDWVYLIVSFIVGGFLVLNLMALVVGLCGDAVNPYTGKPHLNSCVTKPRNVESLLPGYRMGCWLIGYKDEHYYGEK